MDRHLFLFGSGPPFTSKLAERFFVTAGGEKAVVAVFFEDNKNGEAHKEKYTTSLKELGLRNFLFFSLKEDPDQQTIEEAKTCTGVIIGGGETENYQKLIVHTAYGPVIQNLYKAGRPVAGFSAGALITPETCVISPKDNSEGRQLYKKGLGLLPGKAISVHFDTWEEEFSLKIAMKKTGSTYGYGIDEATGIYFVNEEPQEKDGDGGIHYYRHKSAE